MVHKELWQDHELTRVLNVCDIHKQEQMLIQTFFMNLTPTYLLFYATVQFMLIFYTCYLQILPNLVECQIIVGNCFTCREIHFKRSCINILLHETCYEILAAIAKFKLLPTCSESSSNLVKSKFKNH